ncbi:MAG: hypothetical protein ABMA01_10515 [Chthoniobacteraceae bacterium]
MLLLLLSRDAVASNRSNEREHEHEQDKEVRTPAIIRSSVSLFPLPRIGAITALGFALVKMSGIFDSTATLHFHDVSWHRDRNGNVEREECLTVIASLVRRDDR